MTRNNGSLALDTSTTTTGTGTQTTAPLSTSVAGDTLVAFVSTDGPQGAGQQSAEVTGGGLTWKLVRRVNASYGDAEIWDATSPGLLTGARVTSSAAAAGYDQQLTVLAFMNAGGIGSSTGASAGTGAPSVQLTSTAVGSLSYAVGMDWDHPIARTLGPGQSMVSQWVDNRTGNTFWVQDSSAASTVEGQPITLNDTAPTTDQWNMAAAEVVPKGSAVRDAPAPTITLANPALGQVVSGVVPLAAEPRAAVAVRSVQFLIDGRTLGDPVTGSPYATRWATSAVPNGRHTLTALVTDSSGKIGQAAARTVTVQNPAPPMTCFVLQARVSAHGSGAITTPAFHTAAPGETLLALVSAAGAPGVGDRGATVSGAGLHWRLVNRADAAPGDAEIWEATAPRVLSATAVTSTLAQPGHDQDLTVVALEGTDGVGASSAASATAGPPNLVLTTTRSTSLVFAVGASGGAMAGPTARPTARTTARLPQRDPVGSRSTIGPTQRAQGPFGASTATTPPAPPTVA